MPAVPAAVAALVVLLVLLIAVAGRVRAPGELPAALVAHGVLPRRAVTPVAVAVTVAEVGLAAALAVGLVRAPGPSPVVLAAAAALFAGYGGYSWYVTAHGRGGPCGCGGSGVSMGPWVTGRAAVLAALAGFAAATADRVPSSAGTVPELVVVLLAAATIGTLLWHLPAAMHDPTAVRPQEVLR